MLGAHASTVDGRQGTHFGVWAPNARGVSVHGDFNAWSTESHPLTQHAESGVWEGFVPGLGSGTLYKYWVRGHEAPYAIAKADPFGFLHEEPPATGSIVCDLEYEWGDAGWMKRRGERQKLDRPMSAYEVHLGSWRRRDGESLSYHELAPLLADYVNDQGFTHVELMPVMEHPFFGSWGYQVTGFFAPSARFGTPQDLMLLIDHLHGRGIGVILDWVPSHFPSDGHGLSYFDGTKLFEHAHPFQGYHPDWDSLIFNYGRGEVSSFLLSSALFWLDAYHADGLRVDAVASMLYNDYSRKEGEWFPNEHGGRENLEAIEFLKLLNRRAYETHPDIQMIAEESTSWPMVSRPPYLGGLGFGLKWDMGWMHDTLEYFAKDPFFRSFEHEKATFRQMYAYSENFVLPLSHDEVVHGKGSLLGKMPGDEWKRFANLRLLFAYMWAQPGKKLLFMGGELGARREWDHDGELDWSLLGDERHAGVQRLVRDLNSLYREEPSMHQLDCEAEGFEWVDCHDHQNSVLSLLRFGRSRSEAILVVVNFTPVPRQGYELGAPFPGRWTELLNSDSSDYAGSGWGNYGGVETDDVETHGRPHRLKLTLPPLGAVFLKGTAPVREDADSGSNDDAAATTNE